jgi:predicted RecB family nuclease
MTLDDMREVVRFGARGYVQTMKKNKLLGPYAKSEQKIISWIDQYDSIGGIIDAIIRRDDTGTMILDGKNAKAKDFVDPDQLVFYALLYRLAYKKNPEKVGIIWFRYPYEEGKEETGVTWVDFKDEDLTSMAQRVKKAKHAMYKKKFSAKPSRNSCMFCDYKSECPERKSELEVKEISGKGSGFSDFSI